MKTALVFGSRHGHADLSRALDAALELFRFDHVATGGLNLKMDVTGAWVPAVDVDTQAALWAIGRYIPASITPAKWRELGRRAGPERNRRQSRLWLPEIGLGFPGGTGSADMASVLLVSGVPVYRWDGNAWVKKIGHK